MSGKDRRSAEADAWRGLYKLARWAFARAAQLAKQPLCEMCLDVDRVTPATVVNHRIAHKGDLTLFWDPNNHQSVCKPHHDGPIQRAEHKGFSGAVDAGGWPTDPKHPANRS
jgi:5-methylcytosine-specific restriction endonuclease McrA